ncbi:efflux RND transporter periplasmic adaptor subunit [Dyadobacter flavalbus]|uniref:Efflux RND transporter periplasmic adaptor subunit n=1 Tax=Dyadobacter flavalbus TaxID=2579942 RepID=A0A5M8QCI8_9BACT|nr:efflux RND transporter periplasmic adaptor subunit [Dyadobacter flavalbus]KAA6432674.1 efflux RND transporter periplasmic adaptor subunit [Dyadobacter flavalbus]
MLKSNLPLITVMAAAMLMTSCYEPKEAPATEKPRKSYQPANVTTYPAVIEPVTESIRLTGQIEYNPNQVVRYASLVTGTITRSSVSLGDRVAKGQVLAEMRSSELSELNAQSRVLEAQLAVAKRKLSSVRSMFEDRIASDKDLVEAESETEILQSEIEKIQSNLSLYNASSEKGVFQIKAPVSGYVVEYNISEGTQVSSGDAGLFTISDLSEVWVTANVYAVDLSFVQKGMKAVIKSKAYPNDFFEGTISDISQVFDPQERVLKARIRMANKDLKLKPGLTIEAVVTRQSKELAVGIPASALILHNNENYVLIQKPDNSLEPRKVQADVKDNDRLFFKNGIAAGEKIVIKNQLLLFSEVLGQDK